MNELEKLMNQLERLRKKLVTAKKERREISLKCREKYAIKEPLNVSRKQKALNNQMEKDYALRDRARGKVEKYKGLVKLFEKRIQLIRKQKEKS